MSPAKRMTARAQLRLKPLFSSHRMDGCRPIANVIDARITNPILRSSQSRPKAETIRRTTTATFAQ
jgi:hypothetical protein